jgi:CubicO group peptidase (beta-lactamase class C family)
VRVDENTIYHWGSITKTLTAIAIMQLRDRGRLSLDDRIVRWLPELRRVHDPYRMMDSITIRMLLSHSAGFMNSTWPYDEGRGWEPFEPTGWDQLVAMMPYQQLHFRPGSQYGYSNPAFIYLARIIEQLTGDPGSRHPEEHLRTARPRLELLPATPYYLAPHRSHTTRAPRLRGWNHRGGQRRGLRSGITTPNGGWNAPLGDLAKYTAFLTGVLLPDASPELYDVVLRRASLAEMWQPVVPMTQGYEAGAGQDMGLSFFLIRRGVDSASERSRPEAARPDQQAPARRGERLLVGHTGSQAGFRAFFYFDPVARTGVIAAFNTTNLVAPATALYQLMHAAAQLLL